MPWGEFAALESELASFGAGRFGTPPAYLATIRSDGSPRVHPVTPIISADALYVFMEPTSPKGRDLGERGWFALHNGVPDTNGTGGEFFVSGRGIPVDAPAELYVLFELQIAEARCNGYGDVELPSRRHWRVER